jgi:hypothetical protein
MWFQYGVFGSNLTYEPIKFDFLKNYINNNIIVGDWEKIILISYFKMNLLFF